MGMRIEGGKTGVNTLVIDSDGKAEVRAVTETEAQWATERGDAYNINSGKIGLTSSSDSAVLYFKNEENSVFIVEAIVFGIGSAGTTTDVSEITVIRNPTTGTIIESTPTDADMNGINKNFGSSKTFGTSTVAYKGAEAETFTNGDDFALIFASSTVPRTAVPLDIELQKGNSIGFNVNTYTSSGTTQVYIAIIGHFKSSEFVAL